MNEKTKAYLAALAFSTIIGFSFLFTKVALGFASPLTNLAHRYTVAAIVLFMLQQSNTDSGQTFKRGHSFYSTNESLLSPPLFHVPILCSSVYFII